ncbi:MAG: alpha-L-rhamnosidase C-terminal domain-containing protein, partial [Alistipes sp.]|nr:alpha-L-rhamnosidase C-terminal domain-containing protein [Alistipes sp.]
RKAIRMYDLSRTYEGITGSRYPSRIPQYIPPFSLYWVGMVHDYWMHRDDDAFVANFLPGVRTVLGWFARQIDPQTGLLAPNLPHWNFTDWAPQWPVGVAPQSDSSGSAITTLHFAWTLQQASELMSHFGRTAEAKEYRAWSEQLTAAVYRQCWDAERGLLRDYLHAPSFSQQVNVMGILSNAIPVKQQQEVFRRLLSDSTLTQTTFYYKFYLIRAMKKVGLADEYLNMLAPWQQMVEVGLSTFSETPEPTRSDCHAWSASPNYDLLSTVCGVEPASPGFRSVVVAPHLGHLHHIQGVVPHPLGLIEVKLDREERSLKGEVTLPDGLSGEFRWQGRRIKLHAGSNPIRL